MSRVRLCQSTMIAACLLLGGCGNNTIRLDRAGSLSSAGSTAVTESRAFV